MPWQPMHMALMFWPALASPLMSWAWAVTVTKETTTAKKVVNSLIILRAQSGEIHLKNFADYICVHGLFGTLTAN
jgi:hypothetical protein